MENPVVFELRSAAHQERIAQANREGWKQTAATTPGIPGRNRLRAGLVGTLAALAALATRRGRLAKTTSAPAG